MFKKAIISWLLLTFSAVGCGNAEIKNNHLSQSTYVDDGTVRNDYFGFEAQLPNGWRTIDNIEKDYRNDESLRMFGALDPDLKTNVQKARENAKKVDLLAICADFYERRLKAKPCITVEAELIKTDPKLVSGEVILRLTKQQFLDAAPEMEFFNDSTIRDIGGVSFHRLGMDMPIGDRRARQNLHAAKFGDYVIFISESFVLDEYEPETSAILDSIKFRPLSKRRD